MLISIITGVPWYTFCEEEDNLWTCGDGEEICREYLCDDWLDCDDESDENVCLSLSLYNPENTLCSKTKLRQVP